MSKQADFYNTVNSLVGNAVDKGILKLFTQDEKLSGGVFDLGLGKPIANFGSCSYLGLEFDERLKNAAKEAIDNYGTQFSASRIYVSTKYYKELENLLLKLFNAPTLVAPTTTLGHIATIPTILEEGDVVILDHQVHASVQNATNLLKPRGIPVELIRHNNMARLEERIKHLSQKYNRIWYMADGIYSMYGDKCPIDRVYKLLEKYPEFYFYTDDAHGMSCYGRNGRGYVLDGREIHPKMILATSLSKGFATGGAALVFPNKEWAEKVRNTGGPFLTSGPLQPASVAAGLAATKLHLTNEIYDLQKDLQEKIRYTNLLIKKYGLPQAEENDSPIFFICVSLPKIGFNIIERLLKEGFYTNAGVFPSVPMKNTGVRFTITRLNTLLQIEGLIVALAKHYPLALKEENFTIDKVYKAFKLTPPKEALLDRSTEKMVSQSSLSVEHVTSIKDIAKEDWDNTIGKNGTIDYSGMQFLERSFVNHELPEENWTFDYLVIKHNSDVVLATFFTSTIAKDDMLSQAEISQQIEAKRLVEGKYYLTSKLLSMGSLMTEGEHLYFDKNHPHRKDAMLLMFQKIAELQEKHNATTVNLRDFPFNDQEMDALFLDNGYFKTELPENHYCYLNWKDKDDFVLGLSSRSRKHIRQDVIKHEHKFEVNFKDSFTNEDLVDFYALYLNVKKRNFGLNTFKLPFSLFQEMNSHDQWEVMELKIKQEFNTSNETKPIGVVFSYRGKNAYCPMLIGMNYDYQKDFKLYKQALYQTVIRAKELDYNQINLGYSASVEKKKVGAVAVKPIAYVQLKDHFNMEVIGQMDVTRKA